MIYDICYDNDVTCWFHHGFTMVPALQVAAAPDGEDPALEKKVGTPLIGEWTLLVKWLVKGFFMFFLSFFQFSRGGHEPPRYCIVQLFGILLHMFRDSLVFFANRKTNPSVSLHFCILFSTAIKKCHCFQNGPFLDEIPSCDTVLEMNL